MVLAGCQGVSCERRQSLLCRIAGERFSLYHCTEMVHAITCTTKKQGGKMESLKTGTDTLFLLLGAILVLAMHSGFAFLELGTVRSKNQVNALVKILTD